MYSIFFATVSASPIKRAPLGLRPASYCLRGRRRPAALLAYLGERVRVARIEVVSGLLSGVREKADGVEANG